MLHLKSPGRARDRPLLALFWWSDPTPAPPNGVFIDIQNIGKGWPTVEINQSVKVQQGRIQIETGPNNVIKDVGAGTIKFTQGPQTKRVFQ
jgi:hypothetical protein